MAHRDTRRSGHESGRTDRTSVVGTTLSDSSNRLWRRLPRGGITETDRLAVAEGVLGDSTFIGTGREQDAGRSVLRIIAIVSGSLLALFVVVAIALAILSHTSAFSVTSVESIDTEHLTADDVMLLANIQEGTTLLNVDENAIVDNVRKNPWVGSVSVERVFPSTLRIVVHERTLGALASMGAGGLAWLMGDDGVWIEPMRVESSDMESATDAALREAEARGVILIAEVPATVSPVAGSVATDDAIQEVWSLRDQLSSSFAQNVVAYTAATEDDISCIMANGVEVSFGSASSVASKERVAQQILDEYVGQVTYINVRVPSRPTYRRVNSTYVREGTGATGTILNGTSTDDAQGGEQGESSPESAASDTAPTEGIGEDGTASDTNDSTPEADSYDSSAGDGYESYDDAGYVDSGYSEDDYGDDTDLSGYGYDESYEYGY